MKKYINILAYIYILMLIPQLLSSTVLNAAYLMPLYVICYGLSVSLLILYFVKYKVCAKKSDLKYTIIFLVILLTTFISDAVLNVKIAQNDFFDMIIKVINFTLLTCFIPIDNYSLEDYKPFFKMIYFIGIISGLYNFAVNINTILHFTSITNSYMVSLSSFFANRNTYGMFLFITIFCCKYLLKLTTVNKKSYYFGFLFLLINLLLTMSRGAILATTIFLLSDFLFNSSVSKKKVCRTIIIIVLIIFITAIYLKLNPNLLEIVQRLFIRKNVGTTGRNALWIKGFNIAKSYNLFNGVGFYTGIGFTNGDIQFHSFFIDTIVECGLFGLLFKTSIIIKTYVSLMKNTLNKSIRWFYKSGYMSLIFLCFFESVNFFSLGFTETQFTLFFLTIPIIMSKNVQKRRC